MKLLSIFRRRELSVRQRNNIIWAREEAKDIERALEWESQKEYRRKREEFNDRLRAIGTDIPITPAGGGL